MKNYEELLAFERLRVQMREDGWVPVTARVLEASADLRPRAAGLLLRSPLTGPVENPLALVRDYAPTALWQRAPRPGDRFLRKSDGEIWTVRATGSNMIEWENGMLTRGPLPVQGRYVFPDAEESGVRVPDRFAEDYRAFANAATTKEAEAMVHGSWPKASARAFTEEKFHAAIRNAYREQDAPSLPSATALGAIYRMPGPDGWEGRVLLYDSEGVVLEKLGGRGGGRILLFGDSTLPAYRDSKQTRVSWRILSTMQLVLRPGQKWSLVGGVMLHDQPDNRPPNGIALGAWQLVYDEGPPQLDRPGWATGDPDVVKLDCQEQWGEEYEQWA